MNMICRSFSNRKSLIVLSLGLASLFLALLRSDLSASAEEQPAQQQNSAFQWGQSYHNDVSPALRDLPAIWPPKSGGDEERREANPNPQLPLPLHVDLPDPVIDRTVLGTLIPDAMPATILNFDGIPFPGVVCSCAPPDTDGAVGATQYVQIVNEGYQVFNKTTGGSVLGPVAISSIWSGFGGVCQSNGHGDPVVLYDKIANRWLISQFAGSSIPTDECIAVSTTSDATGTYNRYGFHLGTNFFDYPHLGVWPDGYYMAMNVFDSSGSSYLGPQAFAFQRSAMLTGGTATFVTPGITGGGSEAPFLPADLDGSILPTSGVGNPFVSFPASGTYKVRLFHADFVTPANTTFTQIGAPAAAGFTQLCPTTRACVPQSGVTSPNYLDGIGDRLMFRLGYRKFGDGHEAAVGNFTVSASSVAGIRWFEIRAVTTAPVLFQESTYQPDATWRWMGSVAMDQNGDMVLGFSASSSSIFPQIRYAGRLANDPANSLAQGEAHLFDGTGSQSGTSNRWGDYSAISVDPVDDCTFWYTTEYYPSTSTFNWRTRIGNFKFSTCPGATPTPSPTPTATATFTPTATATHTPTATATATFTPTATATFTPTATATHTPTATATATFTPTATGTFTPTATATFTPTATATFTPTATATATFTPTSTATATFTPTATSTATFTPTATATATFTPSATATATFTPTATATFTPTATATFTPSATATFTPTATATATQTVTATATATFTPTATATHTPTATATSTPTATATATIASSPTPTPIPINISGTIIYCSNPSLDPVPGVTLTLTGDTTGSTSSDAAGNYIFSFLPSGGNYTVTPTKAALAPGNQAINTVDLVAIQRHFLLVGPPLSGCRLTAADVNADGMVNTVDLVAVQRFFLFQTTGIANVGKYRFNPVSRSYPSVVLDQTQQNYDALIFGDVAPGFVH